MSAPGIILRLALIALSIASFIPQIRQIRGQGDLAGISLPYILSNLIVATHLFAMSLQWFIIDTSETPSTYDLLDTVQFTGVWIAHLGLFLSAFVLPPYTSAQKTRAAATYVSFVAITLAPTIFEAFIPKHERGWYPGILSGILLYYIWPIIQLLGLVALYVQARETRSRGSPGSLSVDGLFIQALVFLLVGVSFCFRYQLPAEYWEPDPDPGSPRNSPEWNTPMARFVFGVQDWYWYCGWPTINNLIYALAQGVLGWIAWRLKKSVELSVLGEREPLLEE